MRYCQKCTNSISVGNHEKILKSRLYRNGTNELGNQRYKCSKCGKNSTIATRLSRLEKKRLRYFRKYEIIAYSEWPKLKGESIVHWEIPENYRESLTKKQLRSPYEKRYPRLIKIGEILEPTLIPLNISENLEIELEDDWESDMRFLEMNEDEDEYF